MLSPSRDSTWESGTCSGAESVSGRAKRLQGVFPSKSPFQAFKKGCEERRALSHIPGWSHFLLTKWTAKPSREFPLGFQSCEAPERLGVMVMGTGTAASWGFLEGRKFCAGEQTQVLQAEEEGISPKPHLGRFCTFLGNKFLLLLSETAHTTRPGSGVPMQGFVPSVAMTFPEEERDFVRNKMGRKMNSLQLPH